MARDNDSIPKVRIRCGAVTLRKIAPARTRTRDLKMAATDQSTAPQTTAPQLIQIVAFLQNFIKASFAGGCSSRRDGNQV